MPESALRMELERAARGHNLNSVWSGVKHFLPGVPKELLQIHRHILYTGVQRVLPIAMRLGRKGRAAARLSPSP